LEPEQLVRRVAGATYDGTAQSCAPPSLTSAKACWQAVCRSRRQCRERSATYLDRLSAWLIDSTTTPRSLNDPNEFFLRDETHKIEYAAPLRFGGRTKGALIVAFDAPESCGETECRLVDAAAQQAALAAHISALYLAARDASTSLALEVDRRTAEAEAQRRFTDAIIDSLPLSLYAIDRDYRIAAWNRNRELGELGVPRKSVMGKNIFQVLTRQRREVLEREFSHVFKTGEIERIELEQSQRIVSHAIGW